MKLCFLKSNALDTLKDGLLRTYKKYFTQSSNAYDSGKKYQDALFLRGDFTHGHTSQHFDKTISSSAN